MWHLENKAEALRSKWWRPKTSSYFIPVNTWKLGGRYFQNKDRTVSSVTALFAVALPDSGVSCTVRLHMRHPWGRKSRTDHNEPDRCSVPTLCQEELSAAASPLTVAELSWWLRFLYTCRRAWLVARPAYCASQEREEHRVITRDGVCRETSWARVSSSAAFKIRARMLSNSNSSLCVGIFIKIFRA